MRIIILLILLTVSTNLYAFCKDVQCTDYFDAVQKKLIELYEPLVDEHGVTGVFKFISLELKLINDDDFEDVIIKYEGDEIEIGFKSKYILEMVNQLENEEISLKFNDSSSPLIAIDISNPNLIYVLMPMRV